ncbi:MAG TPA: hypothetical protein VD816_11550 [Ohtaekwangia sp.]|nr:hypothetical protein [Ohtaekwangia sp.]
MSYKPNEQDWMAYLYGEMEAGERQKLEQYLMTNPEAARSLEQFKDLRAMLGNVPEQEVIAPPIFVGESKQRYFWNAGYFKTILAVAASLLLIIVAGRLTNTQIVASGNEFRITFGESRPTEVTPTMPLQTLTHQEVHDMIASSMHQNNVAMQSSWDESQQKLNNAIRENLASNSGKIDKLVREASAASQEQVRAYVSNLQTENLQMVKEYFQLTSAEQKDYIENLLVDFAKYLQQQRNDDLQIVQSRLNHIEQNTSVFKQETEQILSSIITTVGSTPQRETKY